MGITGLLPYLQKSSRKTNIKEYSGATVAIDAYCWLHKGAFACAEKLVMNEPTNIYVTYCMKYINMLLSHQIKPILVFDGQNLPAKSMTEIKRRQNRDTNRRKGIELMRAGHVNEGRNILRRAVDVTHEMALEVMRECRKKNVDCIVAPYEADAQLAYFSIKDIAQVVITEDSDLLLFGCKTVMFKMDINGNGVIVEHDKLHLSMGIRSDQFSLDKFRLMCILSGCDYVESLPGIGLVKACKFVTKTSENNIALALDKLAANLNMWKLEVTEEYKQLVLSADQTFRCQLVFDPMVKKLVPLMEPREGENVVGQLKDDGIALQMALGNINPRNLQCVENFPVSMGKSRSSIWNSGYKSPKPKIQQPSIMRFGTIGQNVSVDASPAVKRNIIDVVDKEDSIDLLEIYKKPKKLPLVESNQMSRYFANETTSCLDYLDENTLKKTEERDIFEEEEDEGFITMSSNSTPQSTDTEREMSSQSTVTTDSEGPSLSQSQSPAPTSSARLGLKVFQSKSLIPTVVIDDTTDTVGSESSVFFNTTHQTMPKIAKVEGKKIRVGLKRRKSTPVKPQSSLAQFGFQIRPKISGSPSKI